LRISCRINRAFTVVAYIRFKGGTVRPGTEGTKMATENEIEVGKLFRHKGGKLYRIDNCYVDRTSPRWGGLVGENGYYIYDEQTRRPKHDRSKVWATQWKVCPKYPEGREYQASRELKLKDLTAVEE